MHRLPGRPVGVVTIGMAMCQTEGKPCNSSAGERFMRSLGVVSRDGRQSACGAERTSTALSRMSPLSGVTVGLTMGGVH